MVEAAGVEPAPPQNANWLMARDFSSEVVGNSLPCCQLVVLWGALESSRVVPSLGDILEPAFCLIQVICWNLESARGPTWSGVNDLASRPGSAVTKTRKTEPAARPSAA